MSLNIPSSGLPRVVVIGGGFAGLSLIQHINTREFQVILLDRNNYHTFQPLLYQVATAGLDAPSIAFPLRRYIRKFRNVIFRMAEISAIDTKEKFITTSIGQLRYDYLVVATGTVSNYFGNKAIELNAMPLKTITQALNIRSLLLQNFEKAAQLPECCAREAYMNIVIAGGGPTGVEMAGSLGELKKHVLSKDYPELDLKTMRIILVEGSDKLLNTMSASASEKAYQFLKKLDVEIMTHVKIEGFDGDKVFLSGNQEINTKNLIWAAGVKGTFPAGIPDTAIGRASRLNTNEFQQLFDHPDVFVLGDLSVNASEQYPAGHPMVASVAIQQGKLTAKNLLNVKYGKALVPFHYLNKGSMATIGRNKAVVDLPKFRFHGAFAWFVWTFVHLMALVGFRNRVFVFFYWFWSYFTYDKALRIIIRPFNKVDQE